MTFQISSKQPCDIATSVLYHFLSQGLSPFDPILQLLIFLSLVCVLAEQTAHQIVC